MNSKLGKPVAITLAVAVGAVQVASDKRIDFPLAAVNLTAFTTATGGTLVGITQLDATLDNLYVAEIPQKPTVTSKSS